MRRFKAGDVVVAIESKKRMGTHSRLLPGQTVAHRAIVESNVSTEEAFWKGPCYWLHSLGPNQFPEDWLMTEREFELRFDGSVPPFATDFLAIADKTQVPGQLGRKGESP